MSLISWSWPGGRRVKKVSETKTEANRQNARRSTGPRSASGKAKVGANAIRHGLRFRADVPAIPAWESVEDWETHRDAIVKSIGPVGALEGALAQRVAGILWRLGRVTRYETERSDTYWRQAESDLWAIRATQRSKKWGSAPHPIDVRDRARESVLTLAAIGRFEKMPPDQALGRSEAQRLVDLLLDVALEHGVDEVERLASSGMPDGTAPKEAERWTSTSLRALLESVAVAMGCEPGDVLGDAIAAARCEASLASALAERSERELHDERRKRTLLPDAEIERTSKYEAHLQRMLERTLHELQRLQGMRLGRDVEVPCAVDVTIASEG
jgi:hypothetical protein